MKWVPQGTDILMESTSLMTQLYKLMPMHLGMPALHHSIFSENTFIVSVKILLRTNFMVGSHVAVCAFAHIIKAEIWTLTAITRKFVTGPKPY